MKIGFDFFLDETPLFYEVAKELRDNYEVEVFGATLGKRWGRLLNKTFPLFNIEDYLKKNWHSFDVTPSTLREVEKKYPDTPFFNIIYSDKYLVRSVTGKKYNLEEIKKIVVGHLAFWEEFFEKTGSEAFFGPGIQGAFDRTRLEVMKRRGVINLGIFSTRIPGGRFVFCRNDKDRWDSVFSAFRKFQNEGFPEEERARAKKWLSRYRENQEKPDYMRIKWKKIGVNTAFLAEFGRRFSRYYIEGWGGGYDYFTPNPFRSLYQKGIRKIITAKYHLKSDVFEHPIPGEKFVFFPLHFQPEATTMVLAPYFEDQISLIEKIAKSVPFDSLLYVKEHSASLGLRPNSFYHAIKKLPNVRLIHPQANTLDLIKSSWVNLVITGTVAWESLLLGKPSIVLGNVFFNDSGLVHNLTDLTKLPELLQDETLVGNYDEEKLLMFISSLLIGSYEGTFAVPHHDPKVMVNDNVKRIAEGAYRDLQIP